MQRPFQVIVIIILSLIVLILIVKSCNKEELENSDIIIPESSFEQLREDDLEDYCTPNKVDDSFINKSESDNNNWPDSVYNVVRDIDYLSEIEKEVVIEHNKCRTNPHRYIKEILEPFLHSMDSKGNFVDSKGRNIMTKEGRSAVEEAINALKKQDPLPMLIPMEYLYKAARDHCNDHGPKSLIGHGGTDGSSHHSRIKRYKSNLSGTGENIAYGSMSGTEIVRDLIIDDGVNDRGHRENIFHNYRYIGCAYGKHSGYDVMCVIDYEM